MTKKIILLFPIVNLNTSYHQSLVEEFERNFLVKLSKHFVLFPILFNYLIFKPDLIHFDWFNMFYSHPSSRYKTYFKFFMFLVELYILKFLRVRIIVSLHNLRPHDSVWPFIDFKAFKILIKYSSIVRFFNFYTSRIGKRFFNIPKEKVVVFYENINRNSFEEQSFFNVPSTKKNIIIFGQIRPYKCIFEFLSENRFFIQNNREKFNFYIIGNSYDKSYFNTLDRFIIENSLDNVFLHNSFIPNNQVNSLISKFDFVLSPSKRNFNSGVLAHCIHLKIPFICKLQYGIEERMDQNKNYLFNTLDASVLNKLLNLSIKRSSLYNNKFPNNYDFSNFLSKRFSKC